MLNKYIIRYYLQSTKDIFIESKTTLSRSINTLAAINTLGALSVNSMPNSHPGKDKNQSSKEVLSKRGSFDTPFYSTPISLFKSPISIPSKTDYFSLSSPKNIVQSLGLKSEMNYFSNSSMNTQNNGSILSARIKMKVKK